MAWPLALDEEYAEWLNGEEGNVRTKIRAHQILLVEHGPSLGRPYVDSVKGSEFANMKELRVQVAGDPWRVLFAFDPKQTCILLVGGNKAGDKRWYKTHIPIADARFRTHLAGLEP